MNYKFRKSINSQDIELVIELVKSFGGNPSEIEKIRSHVKSELEELGDNRVLFILEQGEEAVGVVQLLLKNADGDPDLANGEDMAHVHALQIKKSFQRKGLATMMMKSLESYALDNGIRTLSLGVDGDNHPALQLYEKLGYILLKEEEGLTPESPLYYLYKKIC